MLRTVLGAVAVGTTLALAAPAGPVTALERYDPTAGLAVHPEWGTITGHGGVLRRGCKTYSYDYDIQPPEEGTWALEVFISDPNGEYVGGGAFEEDFDPERNTGHYKVCRNTTRYGRFTIKAKLTVNSDDRGGQLPPDHFRLRRPHRR